MKLDDYIAGDAPIITQKDDTEIIFESRIVCDCGMPVYDHDNYCRRCGAAVDPQRPVRVKMTWGQVKDLVRPLIEAEYKKRLELREYCNEKTQHN